MKFKLLWTTDDGDIAVDVRCGKKNGRKPVKWRSTGVLTMSHEAWVEFQAGASFQGWDIEEHKP